MTPNSIECPVCHTPNPATATQCARCATPITAVDTTIVGDAARQDGTLVGDAAQADSTLAGGPSAGDVTDLSGAQGWSRPADEPTMAAYRGGRLSPHTTLGKRYEIVQLLGEGGMGAVYKAMDREVERMVALKIIRPELAVRESTRSLL